MSATGARLRTKGLVGLSVLTCFVDAPARAQHLPGETPAAGGPLAPRLDNPYARYQICGELVCLALVPMTEVQDAFESLASASQGQRVEVIGAIDKLDLSAPGARDGPTSFKVWSASETLDRSRKDVSKGSSLEPLVRHPKGAEGRVVTVSGTFRGANLFDDLPSESRRSEDDWVLRDGPFSIWVTGKSPKGKGFSLDPRSKADCRFRLEIQGELHMESEFIYLRAKKIDLLGRAPGD